MVTDNLFGDILSDAAAQLTGSLGMLPSAALGVAGKPGLYEPIHGSAFDITGKGVANPIATFWTAAMMLEHLGEPAAAKHLMSAIEAVTESGLQTPDLGGNATTRQVTDAVIELINR